MTVRVRLTSNVLRDLFNSDALLMPDANDLLKIYLTLMVANPVGIRIPAITLKYLEPADVIEQVANDLMARGVPVGMVEAWIEATPEDRYTMIKQFADAGIVDGVDPNYDPLDAYTSGKQANNGGFLSGIGDWAANIPVIGQPIHDLLGWFSSILG